MKQPEQWLLELCTSHHDVACTCRHCKDGVERFLLPSDIEAIQEDAREPSEEENEMILGRIKETKALVERIQNYLGNGGLFNPEMMEHDKVRDLLMACRDYLS